MRYALVAGVDGYRRGRVAVSVDPSGDVEVSVHPTIVEVLALRAEVIAIDIPIDPTGRGARSADSAARAFVGGRSNSVFPTPPRAALQSRTFAEQAYSDPDASWGHRSAVSTRKGGGFYGYKIHAAVCARTGLPLAWEVETGRRNESLYVAPLLDAVTARGFQPDTVAMDRGYDNNRVYAECHERGIAPVIPLRKGRIQPETPIKRGTPEWGDLYRRRTSVEREFGHLKHDYGLAFLRVRGIERVRLHADLVMLGRLSLALARARAAPLAA